MTSKDLGLVTAYAYAVSQGYTGTEEEFAELMASYATVAEEAAESAAEAAASAEAAGASETNAASSAASANQSATSAGNSATSASGSAVQAQASATAAGQSATQAAGSATAAGNSATAAAGSATQAAASESAAGASATAAAGSATSASGSATAAAGSATEADASADRAQEILDSIPEDYTEMSEDVADLKSATCYEGSESTTTDITPAFTAGMISLAGESLGDTTYSHSNQIPVQEGDVVKYYRGTTLTHVRSVVAYVNGTANSSLGAGADVNFVSSYTVPATVTAIVLNAWSTDLADGIVKIQRTATTLKMKIDTTLTTEGYAADAKSVGDKLLPLVGITANEGDTF